MSTEVLRQLFSLEADTLSNTYTSMCLQQQRRLEVCDDGKPDRFDGGTLHDEGGRSSDTNPLQIFKRQVSRERDDSVCS
jgi:hypothetical protein